MQKIALLLVSVSARVLFLKKVGLLVTGKVVLLQKILPQRKFLGKKASYFD